MIIRRLRKNIWPWTDEEKKLKLIGKFGVRNSEDVYGQDCLDVTSATEDGYCGGKRRMKYWDNLVVYWKNGWEDY